MKRVASIYTSTVTAVKSSEASTMQCRREYNRWKEKDKKIKEKKKERKRVQREVDNRVNTQVLRCYE